MGIVCVSRPHFDSGILVLVWGCLDPHFSSGIPELVRGFIVMCIPILVRGSPFWYGDVFIPIPKRVFPFRFGDSFEVHPHFGSEIPVFDGDLGIPVLVWGSPNRFGDTLEMHPHFSSGIPVLVWGFRDPRFGLWIPESVQEFI